MLQPIVEKKKENVFEKVDDSTERLKVPRGWLVRTIYRAYGNMAMHTLFIEDPEHDWVLEEAVDERTYQ